MKRNFIAQALVIALSVMTAGCNKELLPHPVAGDGSIVLGVEGLPTPKDVDTRAALDEWENTPVSVGYKFAAAQTDFDKSLTVTVEDAGALDSENDGQLIETGMEYPTDYSLVSFRGYYPVAEPSAVGTITYDISKGDVDVMLSNTVSGSLDSPITQKMVFEHQLTRITFKLRCATGKSYPEPVFGVRASASTATPLMTAVTLELGSSMPPLFKISGNIFCGDFNGFVIPQYEWYVVDMMVQPGVPLAFNLASLTGDRAINITGDTSGYWAQLTSAGGAQGVQYTVQLEFSGEAIIAQDITATAWVDGNQNLGGNSGTQWW
jgi:hypothetical protein